MAAAKPTTTKQWIFTNEPIGTPTYSGPDATFKLQETELPSIKEGQILCKVLYISNDAGLRNLIQCSVVPERFYVPMVPKGMPMRSGIIGEVVESASDKFKPGDLVIEFHRGIWSEYALLEADQTRALDPLPDGMPLTHYLGAFGASGLTAYTGLYNVGKAKPEHTIVISAAAGATGNVAIQIAVKLLGAKRVVGITGSDEKAAWVKSELGAHECLNYNSPTFVQDLTAATPDEVEVYFDNAGGFILDTMLTRMKTNGTVVVCGSVSDYNSEKPMELRNWFEVISSRITLTGFIMLDYLDQVPAILPELISAVGDGRIKQHNAETIIEASIEEQPEVWMRLFSGNKQGKLITKLVI